MNGIKSVTVEIVAAVLNDVTGKSLKIEVPSRAPTCPAQTSSPRMEALCENLYCSRAKIDSAPTPVKMRASAPPAVQITCSSWCNIPRAMHSTSAKPWQTATIKMKIRLNKPNFKSTYCLFSTFHTDEPVHRHQWPPSRWLVLETPYEPWRGHQSKCYSQNQSRSHFVIDWHSN